VFHVSDASLKQLWQQQPAEREALTTEAVHRKLSRLRRHSNTQRVLGGIAIVLLVAIIAAIVITSRFSWSGIVLAASVLFVCVWNYWLVQRHRRIKPRNFHSDLVSFVDHAILEYQRHMSMGGLSGGWRVIAPSILALLISIYITVRLASEDLVLAGFLVACTVSSLWFSSRKRKSLEREVDSLKELRKSIGEMK
jgi:Flp pilus assembly protein TadB